MLVREGIPLCASPVAQRLLSLRRYAIRTDDKRGATTTKQIRRTLEPADSRWGSRPPEMTHDFDSWRDEHVSELRDPVVLLATPVSLLSLSCFRSPFLYVRFDSSYFSQGSCTAILFFFFAAESNAVKTIRCDLIARSCCFTGCLICSVSPVPIGNCFRTRNGTRETDANELIPFNACRSPSLAICVLNRARSVFSLIITAVTY